MHFDRLTRPQQISAIAIPVVFLAAFLPWVSIFGISVSGVEGDGVITLVLALAGAAILGISTAVFTAPKVSGRGWDIGLLVLSILVALIALVDMNSVAAIGLYLTLLAGIAWVVGAVWQLAAPAPANTAPADESSAAQ